MQEARGSSPLSSTALQRHNFERSTAGCRRSEGPVEGQLSSAIDSLASQNLIAVMSALLCTAWRRATGHQLYAREMASRSELIPFGITTSIR